MDAAKVVGASHGGALNGETRSQPTEARLQQVSCQENSEAEELQREQQPLILQEPP